MTITTDVGRDIEDIIRSLYENAPGSDPSQKVKRAEMGIVYIDEFDKLSRKGESVSLSRDVSGEGVQQSLLKIMEGTTVEIPVNKGQRLSTGTQTVKINTEDILFICAGSFEGIQDIIAKRLNKNSSKIGFGASGEQVKKEQENIMLKVTGEDLKKFGMIPEIIGRLPIICPLEDISEEYLCDILTKPKNSLLQQFQVFFNLEGFSLNMTDVAMKEVAAEAIRRKTGARALRAVLEEILGDILFELPDREDKGTIVVDYKDDEFVNFCVPRKKSKSSLFGT